MQWKPAIGASLLMLGVLILARGAFMPADTTQGKVVVFIGGGLVIGSYLLMWLHFHDKFEQLSNKKEEDCKELKDAKHKVD
jgi:hypothetical protein